MVFFAVDYVEDIDVVCFILKGLFYSPKHWPCLDNLITVLFAIGDYAGLLF